MPENSPGVTQRVEVDGITFQVQTRGVKSNEQIYRAAVRFLLSKLGDGKKSLKEVEDVTGSLER